MQAGRYDDANEKFKQAVAFNPSDRETWNDWGNALLSAGRGEEAIEKYRQSTMCDPKFAVAWSNWGEALFSLDRADVAIEMFRKAAECAPKLPNAWSKWARTLLALRRFEEAAEKARKCTECDPAFFNGWYFWGEALMAIGHPEEAEKKYVQALSLKPNDSYALTGLANTLCELKRYSDADDVYAKAVEANSSTAGFILSGWAEHLAKQGRHDEALKKYEEASRQRDALTQPLLWKAWGDEILQAGDREGAEDKYERIADCPLEHAETIEAYLRARDDAKHPEKVIAAMQRACERRPGNVIAKAAWGFALVIQKNTTDGMAKIKEALQAKALDSERAWVFFYQGRALAVLEKKQEAATAYREARKSAANVWLKGQLDWRLKEIEP
jgi:tetratricopeptide (TPR) repeat protein